MSRILVLALLSFVLVGALPSDAPGQEQGEGVRSATPGEARRYLDYYVSRYRLAWNPAESPEADGVGGRLMWSVAPLLASWDASWLDRTLVGGYLTHTPEDADRVEMLRYGVQLDYIVTPTPLAGRIEPLVSLAAGAVRVTEPSIRWRSVPYVLWEDTGERRTGVPPLLLEASIPDRTWTSASVTPGLGARIRILPGLSFRTDARQVIDFRDGITSNLELSGGISVGTT